MMMFHKLINQKFYVMHVFASLCNKLLIAPAHCSLCINSQNAAFSFHIPA